MSDDAIGFQVFRCPSCGKPTPEFAGACRHCGASLRSGASEVNAQQPFLERVFGITSPVGGWGCLGIIVALVAITVVAMLELSSRSSRSSAPERTVESVDTAEPEETEDAAYQARVRSGAVCSDGPNGAVTAFELNVQRQLKDPDSFEHIGTVITPATDGDGYDALMRFRSANSFGAKVVGTAVGRLYLSEPNTCEVRSFEVEG